MQWRKRSNWIAFGEGVRSLDANDIQIFTEATLMVLPDLFTHTSIPNNMDGAMRVLLITQRDNQEDGMQGFLSDEITTSPCGERFLSH